MVSLEWLDPISTASPTEFAIRNTRRDMKAFRNISPSATSVCMMRRRFARLISSSVPASRARMRTRVRRPESTFTSPVNSPRAENAKGRPIACGNIPDFEAALQDDEDAVMRIALIHNHCTRLHIPLLAKWG